MNPIKYKVRPGYSTTILLIEISANCHETLISLFLDQNFTQIKNYNDKTLNVTFYEYQTPKGQFKFEKNIWETDCIFIHADNHQDVIHLLDKILSSNMQFEKEIVDFEIYTNPKPDANIPITLIKKISPFIEGDILNSWNRCLKVWTENGRIEDLPHGIRKPMHTSWLGKWIAKGFAEKYYDEYNFVFSKLSHQDESVRLIAFELLLEFIRLMPPFKIPVEIQDCEILLPEPWPTEIASDHLYSDFFGKTIGSYVIYEFVRD